MNFSSKYRLRGISGVALAAYAGNTMIETRRFVTGTLPFFVIGLVPLLTSSCSRSPEAHASSPPELPSVAVARATTEDLAQSLVLTAEFKPYHEVDVMAKVAGYIQEIRVDVGDRVNEGDLLATLEIPEMADDLNRSHASVKHSQAEVRRAVDEVTRAKSTHDNTHALYARLEQVAKKKPGLIAQQELDDAQSRDLVAEAQVSAAKSALSAAEEQVAVDTSATERVQHLIDYERVTAPFTGVVTKRYADKGSMIQAGTASQTQAMPVVRLSQNNRLRLILPVPESAVPGVHVGQKVEVRVPSLNRSFPGTVWRFEDKVALATRTMDTEVDVPNADLVLIPGMYAEVNLTLARRDHAVAVPVMAVDIDAGSASTGRVMVIGPNSRIEVRTVALGLETSDKIEVRSGLNAGDMVVVGGRASLQPGAEVHPVVTKMSAPAL
jgi:RND family efflux transporter MFP subunit